jgi:hypothetical protein
MREDEIVVGPERRALEVAIEPTRQDRCGLLLVVYVFRPAPSRAVRPLGRRGGRLTHRVSRRAASEQTRRFIAGSPWLVHAVRGAQR